MFDFSLLLIFVHTSFEKSLKSYLWGLVPVCVLTWFWREASVLNPRSHTEHLCGRSSLWDFMCRLGQKILIVTGVYVTPLRGLSNRLSMRYFCILNRFKNIDLCTQNAAENSPFTILLLVWLKTKQILNEKFKKKKTWLDYLK